MDKIYKYAQHFVKLEFMKARLDVFQNESANKGIEFIVKNKSGNYHEIYLQPINLEDYRGIKIPKIDLGELKDSLWIALVLLMKETEPMLYLIPTTVFKKPDNYIFFENEQPERFSYLSNWEIKVFTNAIPELSKFDFAYMKKELQ